MTGHPDDAEDLRQEVLLRAFTQLESFRGGSGFKTWLLGIATHVCLDYVRSKRRWRAHAQVHAQQACRASAEQTLEMAGTLGAPGFVYEAREHIAFCFACVARSLPPEQEVALILREVLELSNQDAARMAGVSEPVLRHHLEAGRKEMAEAYEGLCALVNKNGVCYQCSELRDITPEGKRGPPVPAVGNDGEPPVERLRHRLRIVRDAPLADGKSRPLHDLMFRRIAAVENRAARS